MRLPRHFLSLAIRCALAAPLLFGSQVLAAKDFADLSLEELMDVSITLVSKHETRLSEAAAAVAVVTAEDIRRFGITTLPDALRLVPGMQVARINSRRWAISARGFQGQFADKLLVMIDGRTVYEPMFAGVDWGTQDVVLEDVDRIEVIRGPGATLWGANAVNGIVSIITKKAADTHGTLVSSSIGTEERPSVTLRHGGALGADLDYRVYVKYFDREGLPTVADDGADTDWSAIRSGFRLDLRASPTDSYTLQGDLVTGRMTENVTRPMLVPPYSNSFAIRSEDASGNMLGRWTRLASERSQWSVQAFYAHSQYRLVGDDNRADMFDVELQHAYDLTARQTLTWGTGYRRIDGQRHAEVSSRVLPLHQTAHLYQGFVQDEIALLPDRLHFTIGSKVEHNDQTGFEVQPGIRLAWTPNSQHTLWTAVSRAVRTPDRFELGGRTAVAAFATRPSSPPVEISIAGSPNLEAEELIAYEFGLRLTPTPHVSFDVATFYNEYDRIIDFARTSVAFENSPTPHLAVTEHAVNGPGGASYGAEAALRWNVTNRLRLSADYSWLHLRFLEGNSEFDSPEHQAHLRMHLLLPPQLELSSSLSYIDRLPNQNIDAQMQLDIGLLWRPTASFEAGIWGKNLLDEHQTQFTSLHTDVISQVTRGVLLNVTQRF